jgi:hypothetical protein
VTVISTETSGGGLPNFGVFSTEEIYTVYVDMRKEPTDTVPSWTFEYAVLRPETSRDVVKLPSANQQGLILPFPINKVQPALSAEIVRKHLRRLVIVYAVLNVDGKMEQIAVKSSPDSLLNEPVLTALGKWSFRPAELDGKTVPMKVLLGIPLSLP